MSGEPTAKKGFSGLQVLAIVVAVMALTVLLTFFGLRTWLFPPPFMPVVLDQQEEQRLEQKLEQFESFAAVPPAKDQTGAADKKTAKWDVNNSGSLKPEPYSEKGASREINLSEREINGLLAKNSDLSRKMALDLAEDLISIRLLLPIDPDFPLMGGKTIRARAGAELAYREGSPVVILKGFSLMGVPVPNAWLGGLKNIDLVREFGGSHGFWQSFSDGVETIRVKEGQLYIKLKE